MRKCKACGDEYRKGSLAVVIGKGRAVGGLVCPKCAQEGMLICAGKTPTKQVQVTKRDPQLDKIVRMLTTYRNAAKNTPTVCDLDVEYVRGKVDTFDSAIELVKAVQAGRELGS
jgi:hypothetical protein